MVKKQTRKKPVIKHRSKKKLAENMPFQGLAHWTVQLFAKQKKRVQGFLARRPHRSFQRTRRRDYSRSLQLPTYWAFTNEVRKLLWRHRTPLILLTVTYGLLSAIFVGYASQDSYTTISDTLRETSGDIFEGNFGEVGKAGLLLLTGVTGSFNVTMTETQQMYAIFFGLLTWLSTVWLLRSFLAGQKPKLRDALYNAGAPFVSTFLVLFALAAQLLPLAVSAILFSVGLSSGFIDGGAASMMLSIGLLLLVTLSLYWMTSTLIALVIVTLPGMYPMRAIATAGDLVIGRRLRILLRILWSFIVTAVAWIVVMVPIIIFDTWIKTVFSSITWLPIVPLSLLLLGSATVVWISSYVYLLYRKVVDDDASPA